MSILTDRILYSNNGTITDLSSTLRNKVSSTATIAGFVAAEDSIYIGSELPFNSRFFKISTVQSNTSAMTVKYWDGNSFSAVVNNIDETLSSGASMGQSGRVTWTTDKDTAWSKEDTDEMDTGTTLRDSGIVIYDLYWAELTWSADWSASVVIDYAGYKFAEDEDLGAQYPSYNTSAAKAGFESGKTTWDVQMLEASEMIIRDLKRPKYMQAIASHNQILDSDQFRHACVHKVAQMIAREFGESHDPIYEKAGDAYDLAMRDILRLDKNRNARPNHSERFPEQARIVRR